MHKRLDLAALNTYALTVCLVARNEPDLVKTAVAWLIRNRLCSGSPANGAANPNHSAPHGFGRVCQALITDLLPGGWRTGGGPGFQDPDFCRALAMVCLVCSGDLPDPTNGATRCHRHDSLPEWAQSLLPTALIGSLLFYP